VWDQVKITIQTMSRKCQYRPTISAGNEGSEANDPSKTEIRERRASVRRRDLDAVEPG
jgi:hypothetical protein